MTGQTAKDMETWITKGIEKDFDYFFPLIFRDNDKGEKILSAGGYEFEREQSGLTDDGEEIRWIERWLIIKSPVHAEQQSKGLEKRISTAIEKIKALTKDKGSR